MQVIVRPLCYSTRFPEKSIQSNLFCYLSEWTRGLDSENALDIIELGFSKPFDKVPNHRLLHKFQRLGLCANLLQYIFKWALFSCRGREFSKTVDVMSGVPQAPVFGPLFFIACKVDLKRILTSPLAVYADDIKVWQKQQFADVCIL